MNEKIKLWYLFIELTWWDKRFLVGALWRWKRRNQKGNIQRFERSSVWKGMELSRERTMDGRGKGEKHACVDKLSTPSPPKTWRHQDSTRREWLRSRLRSTGHIALNTIRYESLHFWFWVNLLKNYMTGSYLEERIFP